MIAGSAVAAILGVAACSSTTIHGASAAAHTAQSVPAPSPTSGGPAGGADAANGTGSGATTAPSGTSGPATPATPAPVSLVGLKAGSKGEAVTQLQQKLTALGYWAGTVDGKFGDATQQAVFALQKAAAITPSGKVNSATERALNDGLRPKIRSKSGTLIEVDLKRDLVLFVVGGQLKYILNTSTGGGYTFTEHGTQHVAVTPTGHFTTNRTIDGADHGPLGLLWRPRFFNGGVAIHGDSYVPAHPVSHGCVRISNEAIDWVWANNLDPIGTTVWVYR
ncbi:MAG TPA: L,D-transpeptidase family protein [Micromonosporaceae bacterium]